MTKSANESTPSERKTIVVGYEISGGPNSEVVLFINDEEISRTQVGSDEIVRAVEERIIESLRQSLLIGVRVGLLLGEAEILLKEASQLGDSVLVDRIKEQMLRMIEIPKELSTGVQSGVNKKMRRITDDAMIEVYQPKLKRWQAYKGRVQKGSTLDDLNSEFQDLPRDLRERVHNTMDECSPEELAMRDAANQCMGETRSLSALRKRLWRARKKK